MLMVNLMKTGIKTINNVMTNTIVMTMTKLKSENFPNNVEMLYHQTMMVTVLAKLQGDDSTIEKKWFEW